MSGKTCYCLTCKKYFHPLGIMMHKHMHKNKKENCTIRYTNWNVVEYHFSDAENSKSEVPN